VLERVGGGFYLFDEQGGGRHGFSELLHEPWTADDVLGCRPASMRQINRRTLV
jgi:hypothetical protein